MARLTKPSILAGAALLLAAVAAANWMNGSAPPGDGAAPIKVPELSALGARGRTAYDADCAQCHGVNGAGTDKGPPLVHNIYNPGHHADLAFHRAVKNGTRQHHWPFGDMPPQPQVSDQDVTAIVRYIRELQAANGITNKSHRM